MPSLDGELTTSSVITAAKIDVLQSELRADRQAENPYTFGTIKIAPSLDNKFKKTDEFNIMFWIYGAGADAAKKPNIEVEYAFHQKTAEGEKFFNKTEPQVMNAETLPPQFDLAAGHQLTGSLAVPLASFPGRRFPTRVEGERQDQRKDRDARVDLFGCRAVRPRHRLEEPAARIPRCAHERMDRTRRNGGRRECYGQWCAGRGHATVAAAPPAGASAGSRQAPGGSIVSFVRDQSGRPLPGAIVSAVGRRIVTSVTDEQGRCVFSALPAGDYLVRVHRTGYVSTSSLLVLAGPGANTTWSFVLKTQSPRALDPRQARKPSPDILAAGFIGNTALEPADAVAGRRRELARPLGSRLAPEAPEAQRAEGGDRPGDLRRGRRSGGVRPRRRGSRSRGRPARRKWRRAC